MISACSFASSQLSRHVRGSSVVLADITSMYRSFSSPAAKQPEQQMKDRVQPTLAIAKAMPVGYKEFDNNSLVTVAAMKNHSARIEVLKRHIMAVDEVTYDEASETFNGIAAKNREGMYLASAPSALGSGVAVTAALVSIPLVFDFSTAVWLVIKESWNILLICRVCSHFCILFLQVQ
jgi:hypothetical protein